MNRQAEIEAKRKWRRQGKARCIARARRLLGGRSTIAGYVPRKPVAAEWSQKA